jgi:hypothetical protein
MTKMKACSNNIFEIGSTYDFCFSYSEIVLFFNYLFPVVLKKERPLVVNVLRAGKNVTRTGCGGTQGTLLGTLSFHS